MLLNTNLLLKGVQEPLGLDFGGSGLDFRRFLDDFWSFLAYFGMFSAALAGGAEWVWLTLSMFSVALAGGATPAQTLPILNGLVGLL